jgi:hypothetical protein
MIAGNLWFPVAIRPYSEATEAVISDTGSCLVIVTPEAIVKPSPSRFFADSATKANFQWACKKTRVLPRSIVIAPALMGTKRRRRVKRWSPAAMFFYLRLFSWELCRPRVYEASS